MTTERDRLIAALGDEDILGDFDEANKESFAIILARATWQGNQLRARVADGGAALATLFPADDRCAWCLGANGERVWASSAYAAQRMARRVLREGNKS